MAGVLNLEGGARPLPHLVVMMDTTVDASTATGIFQEVMTMTAHQHVINPPATFRMGNEVAEVTAVVGNKLPVETIEVR